MADALLRMAERVARGAWRVDLPAFTSTWSDQVRAIRELPDGFVPVLDDAIESYVAHDLNNILSPILISAGLLRDDEADQRPVGSISALARSGSPGD